MNLISRTISSSQKLAGEIAERPEKLSVNLASTPREAVRDADIVIAATTSATPLFDGDDLKPGAHVTGVGSFTPEMQEVDEKTVRRARIVVDSREACLAEAGDIIITGAEIDAELGEIINGVKKGRRSDKEITFFKSVGIAVQDAVAASVALRAAEKKDLGVSVKLS